MGTMATGRIRRRARRGVAAAVIGWLGIAAASVLMAPGASAAPSYTVEIKDVTPPVASVDQGGKVTFINEIPDKTVQVGGGGLLPSLVNVTARTVVTLTLPSGDHKLLPISVPTNPPTTPPTTSVFTEAFSSTCLTCKISYTYQLSSGTSLTSSITSAVIAKLPVLPVPTPFVVNTLIALPNLPGVNLPTLPPVTVPKLPGVTLPKVPGGTTLPSTSKLTTITTTTTTINGIPGGIYEYQTGSGLPQLDPGKSAAAAGFDGSGYSAQSQGSGGAGARPGSNNGNSVPAYGLNGNLKNDSAQSTLNRVLPPAALAALLALVAATAAFFRIRRSARSSR
jgi:hypothetical protein